MSEKSSWVFDDEEGSGEGGEVDEVRVCGPGPRR